MVGELRNALETSPALCEEAGHQLVQRQGPVEYEIEKHREVDPENHGLVTLGAATHSRRDRAAPVRQVREDDAGGVAEEVVQLGLEGLGRFPLVTDRDQSFLAGSQWLSLW